MAAPGGDVTQLLREWAAGNKKAEPELFARVYKELRRLAGHYMRYENERHTLQPTALVNEAYVRLIGAEAIEWRDRKHFIAVTSRMMRRVLVDHARTRLAEKRGGNFQQVTLDGMQLSNGQGAEEIIAIHEALDKLAEIEPRQAEIVELRYFGGLTVEEAAEILDISTKTVKRDWSLARVWLRQEVAGTSS